MGVEPAGEECVAWEGRDLHLSVASHGGHAVAAAAVGADAEPVAAALAALGRRHA